MLTLTRTQRRVLLTTAIVVNGVALLLFLMNLHVARDPELPEDARALAEWFADHPADWKAASRLADRSLDSDLPRRVEVWRASYAAGRALAPWRVNPSAAFVRAGLFHWYELNDADRAQVLRAARPLLQSDPGLFAEMHRPLYRLTRDFEYLRNAAPKTIGAYASLRDLAAAYGRFDDYRKFRESVSRLRFELLAQRRNANVSELLALLPNPIRGEDTALVEGILTELDRRPYDPAQLQGNIGGLTAFALDHKLAPLGGLTPLISAQGKLTDALRIRLARASGNADAASRLELSTTAHLEKTPETGVWTGLCSGNELCGTARIVQRGPLTLTLDVVQSDEIAPYVEIYVDDTLVAEGAIETARTFTIGDAGEHRVEVRVVNPTTRSGIQRRLKLASV